MAGSAGETSRIGPRNPHPDLTSGQAGRPTVRQPLSSRSPQPDGLQIIVIVGCRRRITDAHAFNSPPTTDDLPRRRWLYALRLRFGRNACCSGLWPHFSLTPRRLCVCLSLFGCQQDNSKSCRKIVTCVCDDFFWRGWGGVGDM